MPTAAMAVATVAGTDRATARRSRWAWLPALLLAACAGDPAVSVSGFGLRVSDTAPGDCIARSTAQDLVEGAQCRRAASDAGTPCTADSQCQGHCELPPDPEPGLPPTGRCSATVETPR